MSYSRIFIVALIFFLLGLSLLIWRESRFIVQTPIHSWKESQTADCAVALTGGASRLNEGLDLLYRKKVNRLIVSGVHRGSTLMQIFPKLPFYGDMSKEAIFLEKRSLTTYGNATQSWNLVESLSCEDVLLVTSRLHMYRAYKTFRAVFPKNFPLVKRAVLSTPYNMSSRYLFIESIKSLFYRLWAY